ncbi:DUF6455 family protein [Stappia sp.]|jgi:hypothetical protein|uniref:DUF6455 family protein n=1 Tax=Stappia sp. TaxID=1870903 RepID=UPI003A9A5954
MGLMKRLDERATLMGRMMRTVGASEGMPEHIALETSVRRAANRCMGCDRPDDCKGWLDAHKDGAETAPDYCPNRDAFKDWTARAQRRAVERAE